MGVIFASREGAKERQLAIEYYTKDECPLSLISISATDPRVDGWLFMDSPWPTFLMCVGYVILVKVIGPRYMENRPPFELRRLLVFYNAAQVIFSTWLFYEVRGVRCFPG